MMSGSPCSLFGTLAKAQNISFKTSLIQIPGAAEILPERTELKEQCGLDERRRRHNFAQKSEARVRMHRPNVCLAPL
jgi:hypothetical protein